LFAVAATRYKAVEYMAASRKTQSGDMLHFRGEHVKNNVLSLLVNGDNWGKTQGKNATFKCLSDKTCAHGEPGDPFVAYDSLELVFLDMDQKKFGFTELGEFCATFDDVNGNDACPFQYKNLRWYAECIDEPDPTQCVFPKINIRADLVFKPSSLKYTEIPFNPLRYSIDYLFYPAASSTLFTESVEKDVPPATVRADIDGQTIGDVVFTVVPKDATEMNIEIWGAGGGGGGGGTATAGPELGNGNKLKTPATYYALAGGGGGGGGYVKRVIPVLGGTTQYKVTLGMGGTAGSAGQDGRDGGNSSVVIVGAKSGNNFTLTSEGGLGGEHCLDWPCNNQNGNGNGGVGGKGKVVIFSGGVNTNDKDADIKHGKKGEKYSSISDSFVDPKDLVYTYKRYVLNYGGRGGDSGGGQGAGGVPYHSYDITNYTIPMIPGGGGAGTATGSGAPAQNGADGKVIIWFAY
jgi:hypothetical protein